MPVSSQGAVPELGAGKKLLLAALLIVVPPLLLILGLEAAGRAAIWWKYGVPGKSYGLWQYDPELGAVHTRHGYNTNSVTNDYGFRNVEDVREPKPAGALRVIAYGGSTTFCYNLNTEQAWPARLERLLRASRNKDDQVLNAGAIMWSVGQEFARAKRDIPKLKPDVVILYSGVNEEANAQFLGEEGVNFAQAVAEKRFGLFAKKLDQSRWVKRNSVIVRYLEYFGGAAAPVANEKPVTVPTYNPSPLPAVMENFKHVMASFIDLARQNGARPVYVIMGGLTEVGPNRRLLSYSRETAEVARRMGVTVVDSQQVVAAYPGDKADLFIPSGVHWSQ